MSTNSKITNAINVLKREQDGFGMVTTRVSEVSAPATISRLETVQDEKTGVWSQKEVIEKTEAKDERVIDQLEWQFKDDAESLRQMADLIDQKIMSFNGDINFKKQQISDLSTRANNGNCWPGIAVSVLGTNNGHSVFHGDNASINDEVENLKVYEPMAGPLKDTNTENPFEPDAVHFLSNYWSGHGYENFADTNIYGGPTTAQPNRVGFMTDGQGSTKNSSARYEISSNASDHSSRTITSATDGSGWEHRYNGPSGGETASSCVGIANSIATINKQIKEIRAKRNALRDSVNKIKSKKSDLELQAWGVDAQKDTLTGFQTENNGTIQTIEDISPSINSGVEYASIETEELVLHYDARSEKSYDPVGMGTVVYEQASVGYGYTAYLKGNRVSYSSAEKAWEFTGTAEAQEQGIYIDKLNYVTGSEDEIPHLTIEAWIKANSTSTGRTNDERIILSFDRSAVFRFGVGSSEISSSNCAGKLCFSFTNRDGANNAEQTNDTFDTSSTINLRDNNWHQVAVTFDSEQDFDSHGPGSSGGDTDVNLLGIGNTVSKITYYIDGNVTHEINGSGGVGGVGTAHSPIGSHDEVETPRYGWIANGSEALSAGSTTGTNSNSNMWSGFIGNVKYYNEALTDEQIQQNFNALKVEYGLS